MKESTSAPASTEPAQPSTTESSPPPATSTSPPAFIPEIARRECHESKGLMPVDFRLFDTAIQNFCTQQFFWDKSDSPSVVRTTSPGEFTLTLQAKPAPFKKGSNEAVTCKVDNYPRVMTPNVCNYGFKALNFNDCKFCLWFLFSEANISRSLRSRGTGQHPKRMRSSRHVSAQELIHLTGFSFNGIDFFVLFIGG